MHFCNFLKKFFCKFSKILWRPGGSAPGPHTRPAITLNPPKFFPAYATDYRYGPLVSFLIGYLFLNLGVRIVKYLWRKSKVERRGISSQLSASFWHTSLASCESSMKLWTCFSARESSSLLARTATVSAVQPWKNRKYVYKYS